MLDEPLSALDENLRVRMRRELRNIQKQFGLTFIQVTHHVEEAFSLSDQIVVMNHGHIDQVATPSELFDTPASQFVAKFIGDNNVFQGTVVRVTPQPTGQDWVELEVPGIGVIVASGHGIQVGSEAACSVRPDLLQLHQPEPGEGVDTITPSATATSIGPNAAINRVTARILDAELTGYVTRVSLMLEATGQPLLYTVRTVDWNRLALQPGQHVELSWSAEACVFLPY